MAMGQIGARPAPEYVEDPWGSQPRMRLALQHNLAKSRGSVQAWAGLALGVHGHHLVNRHYGNLDLGSLYALRNQAEDCKNPQQAGAYALALGLFRDQDSVSMLVEKMEYFAGNEETRGQIAVALGLMKHASALQPLKEMLEQFHLPPHPHSTGGFGPRFARQPGSDPDPIGDAG